MTQLEYNGQNGGIDEIQCRPFKYMEVQRKLEPKDQIQRTV